MSRRQTRRVCQGGDATSCSAGIIFWGKQASGVADNTAWSGEAKPNCPSTTVDATKIRLICLYLSLTPRNSFGRGRFHGLPGIEPLDSCEQGSVTELPTLPRRELSQTVLRPSSRQFWLSFVVNGKVSLGEVNFEICKHFCRVPFHHWVQAALGHRSEEVDDLFTSVAMIRYKYRALLEQNGRKARARSLPNIKHLHPLTSGVFNELPDPLLPMEKLEFILDPIKNVLRNSPRSHLSENLIILGLRFERAYVRAGLVDWSSKLPTEIEFLQTLAYEDSKELAWNLTYGDLESFNNITLDDLKSGKDTTADLRWRQISWKTEETVVSCPAMAKLVTELAKNLYLLRNYFALTAVLAGVHSAVVHFPSSYNCVYDLGDLSLFVHEANDYEYCRLQTTRDHALPWLSPFRQACRDEPGVRRVSDSVVTMANLMLQIMAYAKQYSKAAATYH